MRMRSHFEGLNTRPPRLLLAMHEHIETFSMMPSVGVCFVPRVFVGNSLTLHCVVAVVCLALFREGRPFMVVWLLDIRKPNFVLLVLANFTNDFSYRLRRRIRFAMGCRLVCAAVLGKARGAESHWDMQVGQCDRAGSPVAGRLGHAMIVGAVACDISWREGRSSMFRVQGGSKEVFPISIVVVWDSGCLLVGYFLQWEKVIGPSVGEVNHSGCARRKGCPGRRLACILWRVGEVLVDWRALSRCEQEAE
ncbi:hypothetical protein CRG98_025855 [Punica granatum]|uniref:Uncharacterized protein n=1 Tax=Punica granatum TaxID=22663 RepID=A0A2I0JBW1_PUNGR|nr:hypothetical protein CRG98_025855 [Punica granatum]